MNEMSTPFQEIIKGNLYLHLFLESTLSRVNLFLGTGFSGKKNHSSLDAEIALFWLAFITVGVLNLLRESFYKGWLPGQVWEIEATPFVSSFTL